jgi:hypothetical protein
LEKDAPCNGAVGNIYEISDADLDMDGKSTLKWGFEVKSVRL